MSDLLDEYRALDTYVSTLAPADFQKLTPGTDRSVFDQLAHIACFDKVSLMAVENPASFAASTKELGSKFGKAPMAEIVREYLGIDDTATLLESWREWYGRLTSRLAALPEKDRLPWFGPEMSVRSFTTARLAQSWAHGQDIFDAMGTRRENGDRLRSIAHLGVITFNWSFTNRGMTVPTSKVRVELTSPSSATWIWNEEETGQKISGSAEEFCLVVTQRRHILDTALNVIGPDAKLWMEHCQCFAGPPLHGPERGVRLQNYGAEKAEAAQS